MAGPEHIAMIIFHWTGRSGMASTRKESDSLGAVEVPADKLGRAQTQGPIEYFSIGHDLMPREMITSCAC